VRLVDTGLGLPVVGCMLIIPRLTSAYIYDRRHGDSKFFTPTRTMV
jgi:hypothetical protein